MTDNFDYCPFRSNKSQCKKEKCSIWNMSEKDCNINVRARMREKTNG
jgi:hypothetical protein